MEDSFSLSRHFVYFCVYFTRECTFGLQNPKIQRKSAPLEARLLIVYLPWGSKWLKFDCLGYLRLDLRITMCMAQYNPCSKFTILIIFLVNLRVPIINSCVYESSLQPLVIYPMHINTWVVGIHYLHLHMVDGQLRSSFGY